MNELPDWFPEDSEYRRNGEPTSNLAIFSDGDIELMLGPNPAKEWPAFWPEKTLFDNNNAAMVLALQSLGVAMDSEGLHLWVMDGDTESVVKPWHEIQCAFIDGGSHRALGQALRKLADKFDPP